MSEITYRVEDSLKLAITIALEFYYHTNIEPSSITTNRGETIPWNKPKAILFLKGIIDESELLKD